MYFWEGNAFSHETSWDILMAVNTAGALGFMNLSLLKQIRWGVFSLSSTILVFSNIEMQFVVNPHRTK